MKTINFLIKKGKHRSKPFVLKLFRGYGVYKFNVRFTEEMWHGKDDIPHTGINKLIGYSLPFHGEKILGRIPFIKNWVNSWLVGWRPGAYGKFVLYKYMDVRGKETRDPITTVDVGKEYEIELGIFKEVKWITINNVELCRDYFKTPKFGFLLKPYFGGRSKAPWDMVVRVISRFTPLLILLYILPACSKECKIVDIDYYNRDTVLVTYEHDKKLCGVDLELLEGTQQDLFLYQVKPDTLYRSWRYK